MLKADWLERHLATINFKTLQEKKYTVCTLKLHFLSNCNLSVREASILGLHWQGHE